MEKQITIYTGIVKRDIYGSWSDVTRGIFVDTNNIEDIFWQFIDKRVKITIEPITEGE